MNTAKAASHFHKPITCKYCAKVSTKRHPKHFIACPRISGNVDCMRAWLLGAEAKKSGKSLDAYLEPEQLRLGLGERMPVHRKMLTREGEEAYRLGWKNG